MQHKRQSRGCGLGNDHPPPLTHVDLHYPNFHNVNANTFGTATAIASQNNSRSGRRHTRSLSQPTTTTQHRNNIHVPTLTGNDDVSLLTIVTPTHDALNDGASHDDDMALHPNNTNWDDDDNNNLTEVDTNFQALPQSSPTTTTTTNHLLSSNAPITVPVPTNGYDLFTMKEQSHLRIMEHCDSAGCGRAFFDDLINLITDEVTNNKLDFTSAAPKREALLRNLLTTCPTPSPVSVPIALENNSRVRNPLEYQRGHRGLVHAMVFDFVEQLKDLLSDHHIFGNLDNLDVNKANRFGKFERNDGRVHEVNSGSWYNEAYAHLIDDPDNEFLLPIIFYVDKTGTDIMQRHGLEPLLFTTSIISLKARQDVRCWRTLGLIPDLYAKSSSVKKQASGRKTSHCCSTRDYHACLDAILQSFVKAQEEGLVFNLRLGDQIKKVKLIFPLAYVINDAKSADMLCARYGGYCHGRICCPCDVQFEDSSNTRRNCTYILEEDIYILQQEAMNVGDCATSKKASKQLQLLSTHVVNNAFDKVCFAGDSRGIYGCTPTDMMHALLEGVLKYTTQCIFLGLNVNQKVNLDGIVDDIFCSERNTMRRYFPRTNFSKGFTNLTLLTATEQTGVCFTLMLLTMTKRGQHIIEQSLASQAAGDLMQEGAS